MNDLAVRLAALDPEAGAAVRVIAHFDVLVDSRAGLQSIVRGAAGFAGCPARLTDPARHLTVRVRADGVAAPPDDDPDASWPSIPVTPGGAVLWLERPGPAGTVDSVVLERAAAAARAVLHRTRRGGRDEDPASVELVLDPTAPEGRRLAAARRLRLPPSGRAVALPDGSALVLSADGAPAAGVRAGVGPAVPVRDLPGSAELARLALRLTAEGTEVDPGPRVVHADDLGALVLLVRAADTQSEPVPDVRAVERARTAGPWVLATLEAVAATASLRDAARVLRLHHSTLQGRLGHAEHLLGWTVREPPGRLRLQLALVLRRARRG